MLWAFSIFTSVETVFDRPHLERLFYILPKIDWKKVTNQENQYQQVQVLLRELKTSMQSVELWDSTTPASSAFESNLPFCCDTMYFHEWLQYVFVPKMQVIVEQREPLPGSMVLLPMAEEMLPVQKNMLEVMVVLKQIDEFFEGGI